MQYLKFYAVKSSSTSDIASMADSILVPSDSLDEPSSPTESTDSILVPEMKKSQSMNISKVLAKSSDNANDKRELLDVRLLPNDKVIPIDLRLHMRTMESDKPVFIYYFVKRADNHFKFIETTINAYNKHDKHIILRGFESLKDSRWTYIHYAENQLRCTLKPQMYTARCLRFNERTSPYVAVNFHTVTSYNGMFASLRELEEITIENFDSSRVTSMEEMFSNCVKLRSITFIGCDFSAVQTMANLCNGCISLRKLRFVNCKLNLTCDYWHMLYGCSNLSSLAVPSELYTPIMDGTPELAADPYYVWTGGPLMTI